jgi:hypothetical protein
MMAMVTRPGNASVIMPRTRDALVARLEHLTVYRKKRDVKSHDPRQSRGLEFVSRSKRL